MSLRDMCLQIAAFYRPTVTAGVMGGIARGSSTSLYSGVKCSLQQPSPHEQETYSRLGKKIDNKAFTYPGADGASFDPTTLLQNDIMVVDSVNYRVWQSSDAGGRGQVYTILAERIDDPGVVQ